MLLASVNRQAGKFRVPAPTFPFGLTLQRRPEPLPRKYHWSIMRPSPRCEPRSFTTAKLPDRSACGSSRRRESRPPSCDRLSAWRLWAMNADAKAGVHRGAKQAGWLGCASWCGLPPRRPGGHRIYRDSTWGPIWLTRLMPESAMLTSSSPRIISIAFATPRSPPAPSP
jgi:hypothetical protein